MGFSGKFKGAKAQQSRNYLNEFNGQHLLRIKECTEGQTPDRKNFFASNLDVVETDNETLRRTKEVSFFVGERDYQYAQSAIAGFIYPVLGQPVPKGELDDDFEAVYALAVSETEQELKGRLVRATVQERTKTPKKGKNAGKAVTYKEVVFSPAANDDADPEGGTPAAA